MACGQVATLPEESVKVESSIQETPVVQESIEIIEETAAPIEVSSDEDTALAILAILERDMKGVSIVTLDIEAKIFYLTPVHQESS